MESIETFYIAPFNDDRFCNGCGLPVANEMVADVDEEYQEAIHERCIEEETEDEN